MIAQLVLGLGFGDEGKGTIVDWLARQAATPPLVVRWNGGPQAAHHVVTDDGRVHCFAQLGSASFVDGARTHLGPEMAVDPYALVVEAAAIAKAGVSAALSRLTIDPRAVLVTPWHALVNQVRELLRGDGRHGSTGRGVCEAKLGATRITAGEIDREFRDALDRVRGELVASTHDLIDEHPDPPPATRELLTRASDRELFDAFYDAARAIDPATITPSLPPAEHVILESAQGALLDRDHGFFPYVTPSWVTRYAAAIAAREFGIFKFETWGVLRAFHTRHGPGPFPSEDAELTRRLPEPHNPPGAAGAFRVGWFDGVLARLTLGFAGPVDRLAVTQLDRVPLDAPVFAVEAWNEDVTDLALIPAAKRTELAATARPVLRAIDGDYVEAIEALVGRRVDLESRGMAARDKRPR